MYYLIFTYYQTFDRTEKLQDAIFEANNPDVISAIMKFFSYIEYRRYSPAKIIDSYRKVTPIFYSDMRDSIEINNQFFKLNELLKNPATNLSTKNEIARLLKFFRSIKDIFAANPNPYLSYYGSLQIISVEDNLPIDID